MRTKYKAQKSVLDEILKQFIAVNKRLEREIEIREKTRKPAMKEKLQKQKEQFESEFVKINCGIQIIRSENETLFEEIGDKLSEIAKISIHIERKERDISSLAQNLDHRRKTTLL